MPHRFLLALGFAEASRLGSGLSDVTSGEWAAAARWGGMWEGLTVTPPLSGGGGLVGENMRGGDTPGNGTRKSRCAVG